jgi:hypothetical protein
MDIDKSFAFEKRWAELEKLRKDYDFHKAEWCRDVRSEYPRGEGGDRQFCDWCVNKIGITESGARDLLVQAVAASVVTDEKTWKMVGGFRAIKCMKDLPRKQAVEVLEAAKTQARAPVNIMRERGMLRTPVPRQSPISPISPIKPAPVAVYKREPTPDAYLDAVALAQYIAKYSKGIPRDILAIVNRYKSFMQKAA